MGAGDRTCFMKVYLGSLAGSSFPEVFGEDGGGAVVTRLLDTSLPAGLGASCEGAVSTAEFVVEAVTGLGRTATGPVLEAFAPVYAGRGVGGIFPMYAHCPGVGRFQY